MAKVLGVIESVGEIEACDDAGSTDGSVSICACACACACVDVDVDVDVDVCLCVCVCVGVGDVLDSLVGDCGCVVSMGDICCSN